MPRQPGERWGAWKLDSTRRDGICLVMDRPDRPKASFRISLKSIQRPWYLMHWLVLVSQQEWAEPTDVAGLVWALFDLGLEKVGLSEMVNGEQLVRARWKAGNIDWAPHYRPNLVP